MTRKDLSEKKITGIKTMDEALQLISLLNYNECIECLKNLKNMPNEIFNALIERAKEDKGKVTFDLITASMQATVNR